MPPLILVNHNHIILRPPRPLRLQEPIHRRQRRILLHQERLERLLKVRLRAPRLRLAVRERFRCSGLLGEEVRHKRTGLVVRLGLLALPLCLRGCFLLLLPLLARCQREGSLVGEKSLPSQLPARLSRPSSPDAPSPTLGEGLNGIVIEQSLPWLLSPQLFQQLSRDPSDAREAS